MTSWRRSKAYRRSLAVVLLVVAAGCGDSAPKVEMPNNPTPLPTDQDRLTHHGNDGQATAGSQAPPPAAP